MMGHWTPRMFEYMLAGAVMVWLTQADSDPNREFQFALDLLLAGIAIPARLPRKKNSART